MIRRRLVGDVCCCERGRDVLEKRQGGWINGRYRSTECPRHRQFQPLVHRFFLSNGGGLGGGGADPPLLLSLSAGLIHPWRGRLRPNQNFCLMQKKLWFRRQHRTPDLSNGNSKYQPAPWQRYTSKKKKQPVRVEGTEKHGRVGGLGSYMPVSSKNDKRSKSQTLQASLWLSTHERALSVSRKGRFSPQAFSVGPGLDPWGWGWGGGGYY